MSPRPADAAVEAVRRRAAADRSTALDRWRHAIESIGAATDVSDVEAALATAGRVTINFHPDRIGRDGRLTADGLATAGRYRSQWVTGTSSGMRFSFDGGERLSWERALFDSAYDGRDPVEVEHPLYGALDLLTDPFGGSPRFGSTYLVLTDDVRARTTFTIGDSHLGPADVGTVDEPWSVLAGLAEQAAERRLLGRELGLDALVAALRSDVTASSSARELDQYVEAQVHGGVHLGEDVCAVVVDPSYRGTDVESFFASAADRFGFGIEWHHGSELAADEVPADFRGATMPSLARRVARPDGVVDAHAIGLAARSIRVGEPRPGGDPPESELQQIKYLWHCLLALGHDAR